MAQASVRTVQYLDPRLEPQPDPIYDYVIGPMQNQYYKIPASGLSNSSLTFNNLTTLGVDRAYLDTFELELGVTITFVCQRTNDFGANPSMVPVTPDCWTFDSFPFNKCCDEARVNINGGAFFSQPLCYVRAKEHYMNQYELSKCYANICPCHRPVGQNESGKMYLPPGKKRVQVTNAQTTAGLIFPGAWDAPALPSRLGRGMYGFMQSSEGLVGGWNNAIVRGTTIKRVGANVVGTENYYAIKEGADNKVVVKVKWREPIFVSPFSSRYDATYGRPLYNITSMDLAFTMQNLGNMIRIANFHGSQYVTSYNITINSANLCYQVMTIPPVLTKPVTTLVPYRRFVPYITDYNQGLTTDAATQIPEEGAKIRITSGVYSLNEMPTAIWVFCGPTKADLQTNEEDDVEWPAALAANNYVQHGNWDTNRQFAFLKAINISLANTTQILATADIPDLYRIAKANGCEDSYYSWAGDDIIPPVMSSYFYGPSDSNPDIDSNVPIPYTQGCGSVLRLKPGVDIIVPDMPLIPGANANNMVFQCAAEFQIPMHSRKHSRYALWLLFEYVGVAAISPGQCEITMNPLGSGEIMGVSPVMSATSEATEGSLEGSGFWDKVKDSARIAGQLADDGIISMILKRVAPNAAATKYLEKHGYGAPEKRGRGGATPGGACVGGAVMGKGLNDWV